MFPILVSDEAAEVLGQQATMVRTGEHVPRPQYECLACREPGDFRTEQAAAVLMLRSGTVIVALVHAACDSSAVYTEQEWKARYRRPDEPVADPRCTPRGDVNYFTLVEVGGTVFPAMVILPGRNVHAVSLHSGQALDSAVEQMRAHGFAEVDLAGGARPTELPTWSMRLERGRLAQIRMPGTVWWQAEEPLEVPAEWLDAAHATRKCLLMIIGTSLPENDVAAYRAAMVSAATSGNLVGALVGVRGSTRSV